MVNVFSGSYNVDILRGGILVPGKARIGGARRGKDRRGKAWFMGEYKKGGKILKWQRQTRLTL